MRERAAQTRTSSGIDRRRRRPGFWRKAEGAQLVEFAFAMPILVVVLIGIIDFGSAFNLKQKLNNAAREGARIASTLACNDCTQANPLTTQSVRDVVENYLINANVPLCGTAGTTAPSPGPTPLSWTFTYSASPCSGAAPFTLTIERSYIFQNGTTTVVASRVTLTYPYNWVFSKVIGLMVQGANPALPSMITSDAAIQKDP